MNFNTVANAIEDIAVKESKFRETRLTQRRKFCRYDFTSSGGMKSGAEDTYHEEKVQRYIKKIRDILFLADSVSDDEVLDKLCTHISYKNPSHQQLNAIAETMEKLGKLSISRSEDLAEQAKQLKKDLEAAKNIRSQLKEEVRELKVMQGTLEDNLKELEKMEDVSVMKLKEGHTEVKQQLECVCGKISDCIQQLEANADYQSVNEQLTMCRKRINSCKRDLELCKQSTTKLVSRFPDIQFSDGFTESINEALTNIQNTYKNITEIQKVLDIEPPYYYSTQQEPTRTAHDASTDIIPENFDIANLAQPPCEKTIKLLVKNALTGDIFSLDVESTTTLKLLNSNFETR